jgi:RluA family pseudouridine synthase
MRRTRIITSEVPTLPSPTPLLDYCAKRFTYLARDQWEKEIGQGKVTINGKTIRRPAAALRGGERLAYDGSGIIEPPVDRENAILYEDAWFVAVNKTGNLPVHPAGRYFCNTLVSLLEDAYGRKVYPVHRLDRETSGVILLAFDPRVAGRLADALARGSKEYIALVHGRFPDGEILVQLPMGRDPDSAVRKKRRAWPGGHEKASTMFEKVITAGDISLIRCFPQTGRLHQIRAHLLARGFPIVGDKLYGKDDTAFLTFIEEGFTPEMARLLILPRSALHAARITLRHPEHQTEMVIRAPLPRSFSACLLAERLRSCP